MSPPSWNPLRGAEIVMAVGGGIAAYKSVQVLRLLTKAEARVQVVMSRRATEFVGPLTFQALSGRSVFTDMFSLTQESEIGHIQVADTARLLLVAPATANVIARLAKGAASDVVSATALATRAPILLAPSMNVNMWNHAATQRNVETLTARGMCVVGPDSGFLACRWTGPGRLAEPPDIVEAARRMLTPQDLAGRRVLVSAGPTREAIDPVRFMSNRSTGRMGIAIAGSAARRGAQVTLVVGPTSQELPLGIEAVSVTTASDMHAEIVRRAKDVDVVVMAAAVADYRPSTPATQKLPKTDGERSLSLVRTQDILHQLGTSRRGAHPVLVGFAAETQHVEANAKRKLRAKQCDLIVANDVSQADAGFAVDTNRVMLVSAEGTERVPLATKDDVAHAIWDWVRRRL